MKQKAKRLSAFILTAAIILSLTACSGDNTSVSEGNISSGISENNTSSDTSKPQNNTAVENTGNKVDDTLPQCEPANIGAYHVGSVMKGDSGYYYNDGWQIKYGVFSGGIEIFHTPKVVLIAHYDRLSHIVLLTTALCNNSYQCYLFCLTF